MTTFPPPADTRTATLQAFLRAVKEDADDNAPRLVLADWLDEQGDATRAELVRLQCSDRPCLHRRRVDELLAVCRTRWHGPLPADLQVEFRRGLIHVQMTAERLLWDDFPPALRRAWEDGWVDSLCLTEAGHLVSLVLQSDWLAEVVSLDLSYCHLDDDAARLLAASPRLAGLAHLDLGYNPISEAGERCLLDSRVLRRLRTIRLDSPLLRVAQELRNRLLTCVAGRLSLAGLSLLYEGHVELLADAPQTARATSLDLSSTHLTDAALARLLDGRVLPRLTRLVLRGNLLTDATADLLAVSAARLPALAELDLSNNRLTDEGARVLARAGWPGRLRALELRGNPVEGSVPSAEAPRPAEKAPPLFPENYL